MRIKSPLTITVDIEDDVLAELMRITGDKNKSPVVARAVTEYVRRQQAREFGRMIREGVFDYPAPAADTAGLARKKVFGHSLPPVP